MFKIAPYYQELLKKAKDQIKTGFPVTFVGMFDCGVDYLFGLMRLVKITDNKTLLIPVDLTKADGDLGKTLKALELSFSLVEGETPKFTDLKNVWLALLKITKTKKAVFVFYLGYREPLCTAFFNEFLRWRFLLGLKLDWIVCTTYGIINNKNTQDYVLEKIVKTNIIPILPHNQESAKIVLENFVDKYGQIEEKARAQILTLSGGNPGLMKSLFLLAKRGNIGDWISDQNLITRLERLLSELSNKELSLLLKLESDKTKDREEKILKNLNFFGYIKDGDIFSPVIKQYLPIFYDELGTNLSSTQNRLFKFLKERSPAVVSRDQVAQTIWGGRWREKYSDWAIDQMVYSLRLKLKKTKSNWQLKTKRNNGYFLIKKLYG